LFATIRNEFDRLDAFLEHYRSLGVRHFLVVDNGSEDGSAEFLQTQPDVSLWVTHASYRQSRFGVDWLTWLQIKFGHNTQEDEETDPIHTNSPTNCLLTAHYDSKLQRLVFQHDYSLWPAPLRQE